MPYATNDGVSLYYDLDGSGETVAFIGECGFGAWQWGWQAPALAGPYETLVYDMRGVGNSDMPDGGYDIETLAADLEAILAETETPRVHLVGAGLGGLVALQYARKYNRAHTLTVFGATANGRNIDDTALSELYPESRTEDRLTASLSAGFTQGFLEAQSEVIEQICTWRVDEDAPPKVVTHQKQAMSEFRITDLYELTRPTLVCHGHGDPVVPVDAGRKLAESLPRGTFEAVEGKRLCYIEHSRAVTDRILGFLDSHPIDGQG